MIYLDASVALAELFVEDKRPPDKLWSERLVSSRLLNYEIINRLHAHNSPATHYSIATEIMGKIEFFELSQQVLARALDPFARSVRTLDGLHLATMNHVRSLAPEVLIASYDKRMLEAALALGVAAYPL
jgi:predicted nucleic acid-binding protein